MDGTFNSCSFEGYNNNNNSYSLHDIFEFLSEVPLQATTVTQSGYNHLEAPTNFAHATAQDYPTEVVFMFWVIITRSLIIDIFDLVLNLEC